MLVNVLAMSPDLPFTGMALSKWNSDNLWLNNIAINIDCRDTEQNLL